MVANQNNEKQKSVHCTFLKCYVQGAPRKKQYHCFLPGAPKISIRVAFTHALWLNNDQSK